MKKPFFAAALAAMIIFTGCSRNNPTSQEIPSNENDIMDSSEISQESSTGLDVESEHPNSKMENEEPSLESKSEAPSAKPIIETGETALYKNVFEPFYQGMGSMAFSDAKKIVENLDSSNYDVQITESTESTSGKLFITAADGDKVTVFFAWDFHKNDEVDRITLIQYEHGEYHFSVSNSAFTTENKFEIGDPNTEKGFYKANSFSECTKFMFGAGNNDEVQKTFTLLHGDILDKKDISDTLTIKAKISSSYNNKATVDQNYYNIEDIIKNQGGDKYTEIQYLAVADMTDGSEQKVVSFTVSESVIKKIADNKIVANQMGSYVDDLFIHASLS